jgi:hypothetical protein
VRAQASAYATIFVVTILLSSSSSTELVHTIHISSHDSWYLLLERKDEGIVAGEVVGYLVAALFHVSKVGESAKDEGTEEGAGAYGEEETHVEGHRHQHEDQTDERLHKGHACPRYLHLPVPALDEVPHCTHAQRIRSPLMLAVSYR